MGYEILMSKKENGLEGGGAWEGTPGKICGSDFGSDCQEVAPAREGV